MRSRLGMLIVVLMLGCAHKAPPPPPPPPAQPKGDLLRFKSNAGDEPHAKVTLLIDQEVAMTQGGKTNSKKITINFELLEEEKIRRGFARRRGAAGGAAGRRVGEVRDRRHAAAGRRLLAGARRAEDSVPAHHARRGGGHHAGGRAPSARRQDRSHDPQQHLRRRTRADPARGVRRRGRHLEDAGFGADPVRHHRRRHLHLRLQGEGERRRRHHRRGSGRLEGGAGHVVEAALGEVVERIPRQFASGRLLSSSSDATTQVDDAAATTGAGFRQRIKVAWNLDQPASKTAEHK